MKNRNFYRDPSNGLVYEYSDQQVFSGIVLENLVAMSPAEVEAHINPPLVIDAAAIAARRYEAETAGVSVGGISVETDDRSKLLINGAALEATINPEYVMQWKTPAGFVELTGEQVIGIARAVRAHVQACFDREAQLLAELDAGTLTPEMLDEGWPA